MATKEFVKMEIQRVDFENRTNVLIDEKTGEPLSTTIWAEPDYVYKLRKIVEDVPMIRILFKDAIKIHDTKQGNNMEKDGRVAVRVPKEYLDENGNL